MQIISYNPEEKSYFIGATEEEIARLTVAFTNSADSVRNVSSLPESILCRIYGIKQGYPLYFVFDEEAKSATFVEPNYPVADLWRGFTPWCKVRR